MKRFGLSPKRLFGGLRTAWLMAGVTIGLLLAVELSCRLLCLMRGSKENAVLAGQFAGDTDASSEFAREYWAEYQASTQLQWHPYVYWRRKPFQGELINIDSRGIRKTWTGPHATARPVRVFMLGGSTMWGTGARDDHTIASLAARQLYESGVDAEVTNFGEVGYVSRQELLTLMHELDHGNRPDLVVFYDGVNDTFSAFQNGQAGLPLNEDNRRREFNTSNVAATGIDAAGLVQRLVPGMLGVSRALARRLSNASPAEKTGRGQAAFDGGPAGSESSELQEDVVRQYRHVIETAELLGHEHGFQVLCYWQPTVFQKPLRTPDERRWAAGQAQVESFIAAAYDCVRADTTLQANPAFHDLSGVFADRSQPVFVDWCHLGEPGNDVIARHMADDIRQVLASGGADSGSRQADSATRDDAAVSADTAQTPQREIR